MWLGETGCGIMAAYREATLQTGSSGALNTARLSPWITSLLSLTLAMNLITTSLIVYRIWTIRRILKRRSATTVSRPLTNVMRVVIESGAFYTISVVILVVVYMLSSNAELPVSDAIVQIIGITFNIIITRVDRGDATQPSTAKSSNATLRSHNIIPLHMINVQTSVTRHQEPDEISDFTMGRDGSKRLVSYYTPP